MPHDGLRDVAAAYIKAFKAGEKSVTVEKDELVYYYRPNPKGASCTDAVGKPNGADFDGDSVFVIAMLTAPGKVVITSGGSTVELEAQAGITTLSAAMGLGKQTFALARDGATVISGDSELEITDTCEVRVYARGYECAALTARRAGQQLQHLCWHRHRRRQRACAGSAFHDDAHGPRTDVEHACDDLGPRPDIHGRPDYHRHGGPDYNRYVCADRDLRARAS